MSERPISIGLHHTAWTSLLLVQRNLACEGHKQQDEQNQEGSTLLFIVSNTNLLRNMKKELKSRRDFFKNAAQTALPILGAIVLASNPVIAKTVEAPVTSCTGTCHGQCYGSCQNTCKNTCNYTCKNACKETCNTTCVGTCRNSCKNTCSRSSK